MKIKTFQTNPEWQLHALRRLLSPLRFRLSSLRDGLWKKRDFESLELLLCLELLPESDEESWWLGLFSAWFMRASHFAAGSLSSITSTFPALKGTIS